MTKHHRKDRRLHPIVRILAGALSCLFLILAVADLLSSPKDRVPVVIMLAIGFLFGFASCVGYAPGIFGRSFVSR